ncbi:MAG: NAD(P)H-hydrate dehydratase, partial [Gemmatimonadota bacterium]
LGLVGSGNNGGDALVLLRTLAARGRPVRAILVGERSDGDALLHGWDIARTPDTALGDDPAAWDRALAGAAVLVDGLLGTGLSGAPRARQATAIAAMNRSERPVVSLDVPTGIDSDTGAVPGDAVRARVTVAFGFPKLGSLLHPARERVGRLVAVEIGFPPLPDPHVEGFPFGATLITPAWAAARRPRRGGETHKNRVGALLLLAGSEGMAGAAVLAARAAFRAGVGLLRVVSAPENRGILQTAVPEAIFLDRTDPEALVRALAASDAVVAGPGMGTDDEAVAALRVLLDSDVPLLLDADALNLMGSGRVPPAAEIARGRPLLLTPHPGEMARISSFSGDELASGRARIAREVATECGCALLLKGAPSLVASPSGPLLVDTVGSSDLATAGMGDVLSGIAGSFLAQGCVPVEAAALGLYHGGSAAALAGKGSGLVPSDVVERLPEVLLAEGCGATELGCAGVTFDQDAPR